MLVIYITNQFNSSHVHSTLPVPAKVPHAMFEGTINQRKLPSEEEALYHSQPSSEQSDLAGLAFPGIIYKSKLPSWPARTKVRTQAKR